MSAPAEPLPPLPPRPGDGHKGTFGTVCVVGGQAAPPRVMLGGPALSALAALRAGAGLAVLAMPEPLLLPALGVAPSATGLALPVDAGGHLLPSATAELLDAWLPRMNCLAIGPGLGAEEPQRRIVARLVSLEGPPAVVDADALNCIAAMEAPQLDLRLPAILTPHPGEYQRLARALRLDERIDGDAARVEGATRLAQRLGCVVVLKGRGTVVTDGLRWWRCAAGGPALATAGTGDVLTGVVAAFVAQFHRRPATGAAFGGLDLFDCARLAVEAHARAADAWSDRHGSAGLLAEELADELPDAVAAMRESVRSVRDGR